MRVLRTAIGRTRYTDPLFTGAVASPWLRLALEPFTTISRAFAPMVRGLAFDVSELAIATFLQARAAGKPIVLLPIVLAARFQEASLLCLKASPLRGPPDLKGRRIGVRTYSQTTGMWLRGFLEERYGVRPQDARWLTFEGAHVSEYADPPWAERAASGQDMLSLLRAGELDAVIVGNDMPEGDDLRPVVADAKAVGEAFFARHGFVPVNHLLTLRREIAEGEPEVVAELMRLFREVKAGQPVEGRDPRPIGREAIDPAITLAVRYCVAQGLLPRALSLDEVWG
jgi:4,5-dihydroxyphthalate decarboxylase